MTWAYSRAWAFSSGICAIRDRLLSRLITSSPPSPPLPPRGAEHQPHDLGHVLVLAGPRRVLTQGPPSLLRDGGPLDEGQRPQGEVVALAEALGRYDPASGSE